MFRTVLMLLVPLSVAMVGGGCAGGSRDGGDAGDHVTLRDSRGTDVGTVTLKSSDTSGVAFEFDLKGLPPGDHAVHVHQTPLCDAPSFESAGPHLNPAGRQHGLENPLGPHMGDMNNITVAADGSAKGSIENPRVVARTGAGSLAEMGGAAIVVHAQADDMKSDPAGNAGDRIACGVIATR